MGGKRNRDPAVRTARGLLHIGTTLPRAAGASLRRRGFSHARIVTDWRDIVGDLIADNVRPERLTFPRGRRSGGTLHLLVAYGGFAVDVEHMRPQLIERLNSYLGGAVVDVPVLDHEGGREWAPDADRRAKRVGEVAALPGARLRVVWHGRDGVSVQEETPVTAETVDDDLIRLSRRVGARCGPGDVRVVHRVSVLGDDPPISCIRIRQGELPPPPPRRLVSPRPTLPRDEEEALGRKLQGIDDPGLRLAFMRLGRAVAVRGRRHGAGPSWGGPEGRTDALRRQGD